MTGIVNIDSWLSVTVVSNEQFAINNIETFYEAAIIALNKASLMTISLNDKTLLFERINLMITEAKITIEENEFDEKPKRLKLITEFKIIAENILGLHNRSYNPVINWGGEKEVLAQIFTILRNTYNKDKGAYITNNLEDISLFLKNNFSVYKDTELSTILTSVKKANSSKSHKVKIEITR